jgi:hypothetical protein
VAGLSVRVEVGGGGGGTQTATSSIEGALNGDTKAKLEVKVKLEPGGGAGGQRITETYESVTLPVAGTVAIPEPLRYSRDLFITYLDEELLVVRDGSGVPEVLVREARVEPANEEDREGALFTIEDVGTEDIDTDLPATD